MSTIIAFVTSYIRIHEFGMPGPDGEPLSGSRSIKVCFPACEQIAAATLVDQDVLSFITSRSYFDLAQRASRANKH